MLDPKKLFDNGAHYGHVKKLWKAENKDYIYGDSNGIHIIDLFKTVKLAENAKTFIDKLKKKDSEILVVCTKGHIKESVVDLIKDKDLIHFVDSRWLGGTLTNWITLRSRIVAMQQLEKKLNDESIELSKKDRLKLNKDLAEMKRNFAGIENMKELPKAIIVLDGVRDKYAVNEARAMRIPSVVLVDSNTTSKNVDYPVPLNDDSLGAVLEVSKYLLESYL